ncbi:hypothetical protein MIR68_000714 [Amoeboaphelidium protococcarum]|nr:hypothetical protein MIR68_000714 [Amoeboaphelidium protococcarum]
MRFALSIGCLVAPLVCCNVIMQNPLAELASATQKDVDMLNGACNVQPHQRSDCGYLGTTKEECERNGCCWSPVYSQAMAPWCFHKAQSGSCKGYRVANVEKKLVDSHLKIEADLTLIRECGMFDRDIRNLKLQVWYETDTRVHFKITDADSQRFEVPEYLFKRPLPSKFTVDEEEAAYKVEVVNDPFSIKVVRKSDQVVLFDTAVPANDQNTVINPLIYEDKYLELSTQVPENAHIFGLGEVVHSFRRDNLNTRQTLWARDAATPVDQNIYGSHPFYMEVRGGKAHGVFLLNANGMDILLRSRTLTYKIIGGVLDFYIFTGPTPADVVYQYYEVIGNPLMIPYWSLGFHQCRFGYRNLDEVKEVVRRYREASIPLETMWTDIDYMDQYKDFTLDPRNYPVDKVKKFVADLHAEHQKYVLILDPAIKVEPGHAPFDEGVAKDLFIKRADGNLLVGKVWPGPTAFPDFNNPNTQEWWTKWIRKFMQDVDLDGWWIDMNEPANFCHTQDGPCDDVLMLADRGEATDALDHGSDDQLVFKKASVQIEDAANPQYKIGNGGDSNMPLTFKTVAPDARHYNNTLHYNLHNLYGHSEAIMTRNALLDIKPGKRTFVLSRSTFASTGRHAGHWTGDNFSTWEHLFLSIPAVLSFQLFGIPYVGADICGFVGDTTEELCARWMSLGAFYPFSRNHNTRGVRAQEPYLWDSVAAASRKALGVRYQLLPYYYTLFYEASQFGATVLRPLFFEFPQDEQLMYFDRQFLVGSAIMVTPVLEQGKDHVYGYFPAGRWYDWYSKRKVVDLPAGQKEGQWLKLNAPIDHVNVHIRGGHIIPLQIPGYTTHESRLNNFELIVALDQSNKAYGSLYLDDGESEPVKNLDNSFANFRVENKNGKSFSLIADGQFNYDAFGRLDKLYVLGLSQRPSQVLLNSEKIAEQNFIWNGETQELVISHLSIKLDRAFTVQWEL